MEISVEGKIILNKSMGQSLCFRQIYILSKTFSYINCCQAPLLLSILKFIVNKTQLDIEKKMSLMSLKCFKYNMMIYAMN